MNRDLVILRRRLIGVADELEAISRKISQIQSFVIDLDSTEDHGLRQLQDTIDEALQILKRSI